MHALVDDIIDGVAVLFVTGLLVANLYTAV